MQLLILDNYDSFTYNLAHLVEKISKQKVEVCRNDEMSLADVARFDKIILSPGPGLPQEAGILLPLVQQYASSKSILGICLGQQAIGQAFGGSLINLPKVYHGVSTPVNLTDVPSNLFDGLKKTFQVGRYHSWVLDETTLPLELLVTARDEEGHVMALKHQHYDVEGLQFHPESILTPDGESIIRNWLKKEG